MANGRIPAAALTTVQGNLRLLDEAAIAWREMVAACLAATGVQLRISEPFGAYRDIAAQKAMWKDRSTSTTGQVAYPGFSVHGRGNCVDINNWEDAAAWLSQNAATYGLRRTLAGEPWHFEYTRPAALPALPKGPDMVIIVKKKPEPNGHRHALVGEFSFQTLPPAHASREAKLWGRPKPVTEAEWPLIAAAVETRRKAAGK